MRFFSLRTACLLLLAAPGAAAEASSAALTRRWVSEPAGWRRFRGVLRVLTLISAAGFGLAANPGAAATPQVQLGVGYDEAAPSDPDRSFDFFPAREPGGAVVLFVQSRFWSERLPPKLVRSGFVRGLVRAGHGAVVIRHRTDEDAVHPGPVEDVARAVARALPLLEAAGQDMQRVFLAGHTSGAQLALLLALDPSWLAPHDLTPEAFAGVIALSGVLDLAPNASRAADEEQRIAAAHPDSRDRKRASPVAHLDTRRPPILLLNAGQDLPGYTGAAAAFVAAARAVGEGAIERFVAPRLDHVTLLDLSAHGGSSHVADFLDADPARGRLPERWQISARWRDPPFTTADFHTRFPDLVVTRPVDADFTAVANRLFPAASPENPRLRFREYQSIDLLALLDALGGFEVGTGDFLVLRNVRGEEVIFPMERIRALRPRVVVGADGERNLFRATDLYHTRRRYSWTDAEARRIDMARPLGAFLFFPDEEPSREESLPLFARYGLTTDSFRRVAADPRDALADLPELGRRTLLRTHQCLACHSLRGVGGSAFHLRARDGAAIGGHALPLERYPAVVWKRFVFEQAAVAEEVGANRVDFAPDEAQALYRMIVQERTRRSVTPWQRPERDRAAAKTP